MTKARRYAVWFAAAALALGTATVVWFSRGAGLGSRCRRNGKSSRLIRATLESWKCERPQTNRARRQPQVGGALRAVGKRSEAALPARSLALDLLAAEQAVALRLKGLLEAVVADQTPPERDPLWPEIVENLVQQWTPETYDKGRDLMLMEAEAARSASAGRKLHGVRGVRRVRRT